MPELSRKSIEALRVPDGAREAYLWCDELPSFGIRAFSGGARRFIVKYRVKGETKQRKVSLGPVPERLSVETIRNMREVARDTLARARVGEDIQPKPQQKAAEPKELMIGDLVTRYLKLRKEDVRPRSYVEIERHLEKRFSGLHDTTVDKLTRREIVDIVDQIAEKHGRAGADRARASLSAFLGWCVERNYIDLNPAIGIKRRAAIVSRDRVLRADELSAVWHACPDDDYGRIVRLLTLTGCRREEIAGLSWHEIDFEEREIRLPPERCKNARAHTIPLSDPALAILKTVARRHKRELLFGSGEGPFSGWSVAKKRMNARLGDTVKPWTLHDLRRSFATHCSDLDFAPPHIIEMALNHWSGSKAGLVAVYNRAKHDRERRELMKKWGAHIAALVSE
jgi:integrase